MTPDISIQRIDTDKSRLLDILLLGDESETMINSYLDCGELFALEQRRQPACLAVVVDEGIDVELKNLVTVPEKRKQGFASTLIHFLLKHHTRPQGFMYLGTGEAPSTLRFYQHLGFQFWKREKGYFLRHYDHPMFEENIQLVDRIFLRQSLSCHSE